MVDVTAGQGAGSSGGFSLSEIGDILKRGDLELWGVDKVDGQMASIAGQIQCTDSGRWPVQREFNRRMKRRFQECGIEMANPGATVLIQVPAPSDTAPGEMPKRAAR